MSLRSQIDTFLEPLFSLIYLKQCSACSNETQSSYLLFCNSCQNQMVNNFNIYSLYNGHLVLFDPIEPVLSLLDLASKENYYAQELIKSFFLTALDAIQWSNDSIQLHSKSGDLKYHRYLKRLEKQNKNTTRYLTLRILPSELESSSVSIISLTHC